MGIEPQTKDSKWSTYNPVTHTGGPAHDTEAGVKSNKFATATAAQSHLHGGACMPKEVESKANTRPHASSLHLPARVDHLSGTACIASSARSMESSSNNTSWISHSKQAATKARILTLRAAVDHLSGEGCTVREVDVVATLDAPLPTVTRGMATRLVRDRQVAHAAHEHNMSSCLYQPGHGYTKVIAGQEPSEGHD